MKKRLFLVFALALIVCTLFALGTSAKTLTTVDGETVEVTIIPNAPAKSTFANSTDDYVIFDNGFACPSTYIFKDAPAIESSGTHRVNLANALDFSFLSDNGYYANAENKTAYTVNNIVEVDLPQGITSVCDFVAYGLSTLEKITFPNTVTSIGGVGFQDATGLKECVFEHGKTDPVSINANYMFYRCSSLRAVSFPDSVTTLNGEGYFFFQCNALTAVHLPKSLTSIASSRGGAPFDQNGNMYFTNESFSTSDTAPAKPQIYYFPKNLSVISENSCAFRSCSSLNEVVVFGTGVTSLVSNYYFQSTPNITVVFLGDMVGIDSTYWGCSKVIFANANDKSSSDIANYKNSKTTVFCASESDISKHLASPNHSTIEPATCYSNEKGVTRCFCNKVLKEGETPNTMLTTHNYIDDFNCTTPNLCKNFGEGKCDKFLDAEFDAHNTKHIVAYANGFASAGLHTIWCDNSTCEALDEKITIDAMLLPSGGYSTNGRGGLGGGWTVNTTLVKLYNDYNEKDVKFGILMLNPEHLASERFMRGYEVNLADDKSGALLVDMTGSEYSNFAFSVNGFDASQALKELELVITAYAYTEGNDVEFIQDATTVCKVSTLNYADGSLYTVSYEKATSELQVVSTDAIVPTVKKENF